MTINLKIEVLKIFCLEFSLYSDKDLKLKREKPDEKDAPIAPPSGKPANPVK
jgi:hypothetical protein